MWKQTFYSVFFVKHDIKWSHAAIVIINLKISKCCKVDNNKMSNVNVNNFNFSDKQILTKNIIATSFSKILS